MSHACASVQQSQSNVVVAGLALFSMFFGAGDLIWPLVLGGNAGDQNFFAMMGLLITGVSLPLLGLVSMMLFQGNYHAFFGRMGRGPAILMIFIVQMILGPIGSIPRALTLSHATLKPYISEDLSLLAFSIGAACLVFAFTMRPQKIIDVLGLVLTPLLLLCLGAILVIGFLNHPSALPTAAFNEPQAFYYGLGVGYNTLDLIASFIFAPLVLSHFIQGTDQNNIENRKLAFTKMLKASLLAAGLLSAMYIGLTFISSYYTPLLATHQQEERLSAIALYLLGPYGAFIACIAVAMACLTTVIPLVSIFANYLKEDLMGGKGGTFLPIIATLVMSIAFATMGFMGIANMLSPILQILCPGLIVLSVFNIFHKLWETRVPRVPVFATFAVSAISHFSSLV